MCTPEKTTMQVRVPGAGALPLDCWLCSLSFWPHGDALCTNFCKWEVVINWKEPFQNVFNTVLLNLCEPVFLCREERNGTITQGHVFICPFFQGLSALLRASLNHAAEPIFASLLWCKGFDCSQLAKNDSSLETAEYCLVCIKIRAPDFWAEVCYHFWPRLCSNFSSLLPTYLSSSQHKHLYSKDFYSF